MVIIEQVVVDLPAAQVKIFFIDGHKATFKQGFHGDPILLSEFCLEIDGRLVAHYISPYQLVLSMDGKFGFRPIEGGYKNYNRQRILAYWQAATDKARAAFKPQNPTFSAADAYLYQLLVVGSRSDFSDIAAGKIEPYA